MTNPSSIKYHGLYWALSGLATFALLYLSSLPFWAVILLGAAAAQLTIMAIHGRAYTIPGKS